MIRKIFSIGRLFLPKREESFYLLKAITGFKPKNIALYTLAFTHKSSSIIDTAGRHLNNERLEYLGDAILDAIIADYLYIKFPTKKEGFLTNLRSRLVNRVMLNTIALKIGLDKLIVSTANRGNSNIYGNAFEALVGAMYLDHGYDKCSDFVVHRVLEKYVNLKKISHEEINFKSKLLEYCQKNRKQLDFELIEESIGKYNTPIFITQAKIDGEIFGTGSGPSKKESHQHAAQEALQNLKGDEDL